MPNWVYNQVTITSENEALLTEIREQLAKPVIFREEKNLDGVVVIEDTVTDVEISFQNIVPITQGLDVYYAAGTGTQGWYEWNLANWGTKWDAGEIDTNHETGTLSYRFSTAWSSPIPVFAALSAQYPTANIEVKWEEEQGFGEMSRWKAGLETVVDSWDVPETHQEMIARRDFCYCLEDYDSTTTKEDMPFDTCPWPIFADNSCTPPEFRFASDEIPVF